MVQDTADVAVLGGGPAGMEAALVISRTGKRVVVFDDPEPPRNAASHGAHNFLGVEGLRPQEVRALAWEQICRYGNAELREERAVDIDRQPDGRFHITGHAGTTLDAPKVLLAVGYRDVYPDVPGFLDCWADTIIPCPFCDGYENRNRVWGIVPRSMDEVRKFPLLARNWTDRIRVFLEEGLELDPAYRQKLSALDITVHQGSVARVLHSGSKVESVVLDTGKQLQVGTLLWVPAAEPSPLVGLLRSKLGMELSDGGQPKTDEALQTSIAGLWAAGDVLGWAGVWKRPPRRIAPR